MTSEIHVLRRRIKLFLWIFIIGLILSGLTAFPIKAEADFLQKIVGEGTFMESRWPQMAKWISSVHSGVTEVSREYPFLFYGTDWLAFAHIVIAIAFIGSLRDPVKNIWVIEFGMIACVLVIPTALVCGPIRGIPFFWRLIDCSFGVLGIIPLYFARKYTRRVIELNKESRMSIA